MTGKMGIRPNYFDEKMKRLFMLSILIMLLTPTLCLAATTYSKCGILFHCIDNLDCASIRQFFSRNLCDEGYAVTGYFYDDRSSCNLSLNPNKTECTKLDQNNLEFCGIGCPKGYEVIEYVYKNSCVSPYQSISADTNAGNPQLI